MKLWWKRGVKIGITYMELESNQCVPVGVGVAGLVGLNKWQVGPTVWGWGTYDFAEAPRVGSLTAINYCWHTVVLRPSTIVSKRENDFHAFSFYGHTFLFWYCIFIVIANYGVLYNSRLLVLFTIQNSKSKKQLTPKFLDFKFTYPKEHLFGSIFFF